MSAAPRPALRTAACDLFGVRYPIVQTGMGFVSGPRLTAATANAGGLGIIAGATMSYPQLAEAIAETRRRTDAPFGVNLRADAPDAAARFDLLAKERVRVASFALAPRPDLVSRLKDAGTVVVASVGARRHAEKVAAWGVDAVIVQGAEGGGHTGGTPTTLLLPQVVDAVDVPVLAAGGFFDGRGLVAALSYGAAGVAMGTRFLLTSDCPVSIGVKRRYLAASVDDTVVTDALDGVRQRVLRTGVVDDLARAGPLRRLRRSARSAAAFRRLSGASWRELIAEGAATRRARGLSWAQVLMAANPPMLLKAAMVDGRTDLGVMASGQVAGVIDDLPSCAALIDRIMAEAGSVLDRLTATGMEDEHREAGRP